MADKIEKVTCHDDITLPIKAQTIDELHHLQKKRSSPTTPIGAAQTVFSTISEEDRQRQQLQSISASLASLTRETGPNVVKGDPARKGGSAKVAHVAHHHVAPTINISDSSLKFTHILYNLSPAELYEQAIRYEKGSFLTSTGALATLSGAKTGRSPRDKRVVKDETTENELWWGKGSPNIEMDEHTFLVNRERAVDYLNSLDKVFVNDQFLNWDPENKIKVRIVSARAYHSLFMHNMCIRPTDEELEKFGAPDFTIYNAGQFPCNRFTHYMTSSTSVDMNLRRREMVILGTQYAGEMKKGLFSVMHYLMPKRQILSLHSGCNMGKDRDVALFFGLSGTGKPQATFSACFGAAFIMLHPTRYAAMLAEKMKKHGATGWLVNTGWSGGQYGSGSRIKLSYTRKIIDAIHSGELLNADYRKTKVFGLEIPAAIEGVPSDILDPINTWSDKKAYEDTLLKLAGLFKNNFETFTNYKIGEDNTLTEEILAAGPNF
ncbi:phosphoenolpyruvate carboxykinase (ATP)-like [Momordica charantia]|uniref:phosphoenolpyruvate carboxykinase (ATP) n=1 Tax=Momordica charantia TaxID=3673 RepID=A0A6J1BT59_MOMCH|nr:phosphoenolpyruvate carboxykinase (ATP)-like [Momordica charantia]